jgi:hypothetical protein
MTNLATRGEPPPRPAALYRLLTRARSQRGPARVAALAAVAQALELRLDQRGPAAKRGGGEAQLARIRALLAHERGRVSHAPGRVPPDAP